jgi:hypothetical protein
MGLCAEACAQEFGITRKVLVLSCQIVPDQRSVTYEVKNQTSPDQRSEACEMRYLTDPYLDLKTVY